MNLAESITKLPRLYSAAKVAEALGVSRRIVYKWADLGVLPVVPLGRRRMFSAEDVEQFVASRRKAAAQ